MLIVSHIVFWGVFGALLTGGAGYVPGTLMGVLIFGLIQALINFHGDLNSAWTRISVGMLLLAFIGLQKLLARGN